VTRACHGPIRAATGDAFSDEEIDEIVDRLARRFERKKGEMPGADDVAAMEEAAASMTREAIRDALVARRLQAAAERAQGARRTQLASLPGDAADRLRALNVGTEKQGDSSGFSVDAEQRARTVAAWGEVESQLRAEPGLLDRVSNFWGAGESGFDRKVAREMARLNGAKVEATGDAGAETVARIFVAALEKNRQAQNAVGAWIGRLDGYVGRQSHDRLRVAGGFWRELKQSGVGAVADWSAASRKAEVKAFRDWHDFIRPKLDDGTFEGIDPEDIGRREEAAALFAAGVLKSPDDLRERFLYRAWSNIVTGRHEVLAGSTDLGEFRMPAGKARAVSRERVLHFTSPDAWMDYHETFGRGSLFGSVMTDLERGAKNAALMARWGPNPDAAFDNTVAELADQARMIGDNRAVRRLGQVMRRAEFEEVTGAGNVPESLRFAIVGRTIRLDQTLSKLGGMVLSSLSDAPLAAAAHARAGGRFLDGYAGVFKGVLRLQGEDGKRAADLLDVGARSGAAHLTGRFMATDGPLGWAASASRLFYKINLFELWADGLRRGVAEMLSAHMGENAGRAFGKVDIGLQETLQRFGLDAGAWEMIRKGAVKADDGRTYLTFEALEQIPDEALLAWRGAPAKADPEALARAAAQARDDLTWRFRAMVTNQLDDALTEARARERVGLLRDTKAGTPWGEAVRMFTQFWSFNQAVIGRHVAPAARGHSGRTPAALLAHIIVASGLMGYASLQAKQIVKGRTPRPLTNEDGELDMDRTGKLVLASLLQGGGLGIYGDFLFGEANRSGGTFQGSLAGPGIGEMEKLFQIAMAAKSGDLDDMPADLLRFGVGNTPFANLWYARLGLDYAVLWRLQEAASPGYLQRYEDRVRKQTGSDFWLDPSEAVQ
jgi:hypothetical protein